MFECIETKDAGLTWLVLKGRIDAMSAGEIGRRLDALMNAGDRIIGADLLKINYISSAGIRVFLTAQKKLLRVEGQILLAHVQPDVLNILKMSGLDTVFHIVATREEAAGAAKGTDETRSPFSKTLSNIPFTCLEKDAPAGSLTILGDTRPLVRAGYGANDVTTISSADMRFGMGLGSLGQEWDHFKGLFGEAMVIDHNFFFYPAVKKPAVDYLLWSPGNAPIPYRFLNGVAFQGEYRYKASFGPGNRPVSLEEVVQAVFQLSDRPLLGVVLIGEVKGAWGMHLRRVPVSELQPEHEKNIFHPERIHDWMDLPVEPAYVNHVAACVGIAVRERERAHPSIQAAVSEGQNFHMHGGIFEKGLFSTDPAGFETEVLRILTQFEPLRIQHLLGRSLFRTGVVGVVELEPEG